MNIRIDVDDLSDGEVEALLNEHLSEMKKYSPSESIHALDSKKLRDPSITFWSARTNDVLVGCGALKELSPLMGEIKSMKTREHFTRKGIGAKILSIILAEAKKRRYQEINLETGSNIAFSPAIEMYKKFEFKECGPFGDYKSDPYSRFFKKSFEYNG